MISESFSSGTVRRLIFDLGFFLLWPWHPLALLENEVYCFFYMLLDPLKFGNEELLVYGSLYPTALFSQGLSLMLYDCCVCN